MNDSKNPIVPDPITSQNCYEISYQKQMQASK